MSNNGYTPKDDDDPNIELFYNPANDLFRKLRESRGWSDQFLIDINSTEHPPLQNQDVLIDALHYFHTRGEKIVIVPDFDVDGVTSGTLGHAGLAELGFNVGLHLPDYRRGHDVSPLDIHEVRENHPDAVAILTCDGGINSHDGIELAKRLGLYTMVTDHHIEERPGSSAHVSVNPSRLDETYPHPSICGAHVLYQVIEAYTAKYQPEKLDDIHLLKLFAGVGTIADVMDVTYENRQLVRDAISIARLLYVPCPKDSQRKPQLDIAVPIQDSILIGLLDMRPHHEVYKAAFKGFATLLATFVQPQELVDATDPSITYTTKEHLREITDLNEEFFAYYLAPTFNAIRRIDGEMYHAFNVFLPGSDAERSLSMRTLMEYNNRRRKITGDYLEELETTDQPYAPFVYISSAPTGMLGLLAGNLAERQGHATVVLRKEIDPTKNPGGSARAPFWYNVIDELAAHNLYAVGHQQACGVKLKDTSEIPLLAAALRTTTDQAFTRAQADGSLEKALVSDLVLGDDPRCDGPLDNLEELTYLIEGIEQVAPFGHAFPRPLFELVLDLGECTISTIGTEKQHLRISTQEGFKILWWNSVEDHLLDLRDKQDEPLPHNRQLRLRVTLSMNNFMGNSSPQAVVDTLLPDLVPTFETIDSAVSDHLKETSA